MGYVKNKVSIKNSTVYMCGNEEMLKKAAIHNLGCKVNSYEAESMELMLKNAGYEIVPFDENIIADVYIINTCSVTNIADRKSRQMLHKAKKMNPLAVVVAAGCYVQTDEDGVRSDEAVDIVLGNNMKINIVDVLEEYFKDNSRDDYVLDINNKETTYEELKIDKVTEHTRAYIKIQDGCNQFCSYCIIPYARGRIRSRKMEDIINEVTNLANNGYKEIVITGIHLSSYGLDFEHDDTFTSTDYNPFMYKYLIKLLDEMSKVKGIERIRLGSLEPRIITNEFLEDLSANKKICPHFHLSLQSGCDETLKRMNRKYTCEVYMNGLNLLRKYFDNPAITTDVIVGFPKEDENEFEQTTNFLKECNFSMIHVFKYSRRKGTVADKMDGQIDEQIKTQRSAQLLNLTASQHKEYMESFIGKKEKVLFEEIVNIDGHDYFVGHNERYVKIAVDKDGVRANDILNVTIKKQLSEDVMYGEICKK